MNFKYSVITDNTEAARKWLEMLGYKFRFAVGQTRYTPKFIITRNIELSSGKHVAIADLVNVIGENKTDSINCIGNPQLFKAVSAMRNDSDYMQWFISENGNRVRYEGEGFFDTEASKYDWEKFCKALVGKLHKATLSELQEHFK